MVWNVFTVKRSFYDGLFKPTKYLHSLTLRCPAYCRVWLCVVLLAAESGSALSCLTHKVFLCVDLLTTDSDSLRCPVYRRFRLSALSCLTQIQTAFSCLPQIQTLCVALLTADSDSLHCPAYGRFRLSALSHIPESVGKLDSPVQ